MATTVKEKNKTEFKSIEHDKNLPAIVRNGEIDIKQWQSIKDVIFPGVTNDSMIEMAINYCKVRNLDIMKKPVHIVKFGKNEVILPGISEIRTTAFRTGLYAGKDSAIFGPDITETWEWKEVWDNKTYNKLATVTYPEWVEQTVYRLVGTHKASFVERVWWKEAYATVNAKEEAPNTMWRDRPYGQLAKCGEAASLRCAFPEELGSILAMEEVVGATNYTEKQPPEPKELTGDPVERRMKEKESKITEGILVAQKENEEFTKLVEEINKNPKEEVILEEPKEFKLEEYRIIKKGKKGTTEYKTLKDALAALAGIISGYPKKEDRQIVADENRTLLIEVEKAGYVDSYTEFKDLIMEGK